MHRSTLALAGLLAIALLLPAVASAGKKDLEGRLSKATEIFGELDGKIPDHLKKDARCVSVLIVGKGGFIVGGTGGTGFLTCRSPGGKVWSAPVVLDVGGTSAGAQIGGAKLEVVMIFTDVDDIDEVASATPVFSGTAGATAGDAGVGVSAGGNPEAEAGVFTFSQSEGLYAGATWEALVIDPDQSKTAELLGAWHPLQQVLIDRKVAVPAKAKGFVEAVAGWAK
jgi:SH3 domain-containing YSC84-like protein 1